MNDPSHFLLLTRDPCSFSNPGDESCHRKLPSRRVFSTGLAGLAHSEPFVGGAGRLARAHEEFGTGARTKYSFRARILVFFWFNGSVHSIFAFDYCIYT